MRCACRESWYCRALHNHTRKQCAVLGIIHSHQISCQNDGILFGIFYFGVVVCFFVVTTEINMTMTGFDSRDSCLKFIEHKNEDGSLLTVDTGERCLGFCEDVDPDDKVYKVQENLFISSQDGAQNIEELRRNNITHILNVGTGIMNAFPEVVLKICCQWFYSGISCNSQECVCGPQF